MANNEKQAIQIHFGKNKDTHESDGDDSEWERSVRVHNKEPWASQLQLNQNNASRGDNSENVWVEVNNEIEINLQIKKKEPVVNFYFSDNKKRS